MKKLMLIIIMIFAFTANAFAVSYTVCEGTTGRVVAKNDADKQVNAGVISKLMTALLTAQKIENGELSVDKLITVNSAVTGTKGSVVWLTAGERITIHELLKGLLTGNANDCAVALACEIGKSKDAFLEMMNSKASQMGMKNTHFNDVINDCTTTARDMVILANEVSKHEILREYMITYMDYIRNGETMLVNNNKLVRNYKGITGLIAGATEKSGWCIAASATREDKSYTCVIIGEEDEDATFIDAKELLNMGFSTFSLYTPQIDESLLCPIDVKKGVERKVNIKVNGTETVVIKNGEEDLIDYEITTEPFLTAPVSENQRVGSLIIKKNDSVIANCDIVTTENIEKMTVWKYFISFMRSFFILNF